MRLALFLTYGGSLAAWRAAGILEREMSLYQAHARAGVSTTIVSYGGVEDQEIAAPYPFADVLVNRHGLHPRLYGSLVPWLHRAAIAKADVIKTNQLYGARQALRAGRLTGKPVVIRQGYGYVEHTARDHGAGSRATRRAIVYERDCLPGATVCLFTTEAIAGDCLRRVALPDSCVRIMPNYVDGAYWTPPFSGFRDFGPDSPMRIAFFGRFTEQKNLESLIDASAGLPVELLLIGDGMLRQALAERARAAGVAAAFPGRLGHTGLRVTLQGCDAVACVSHYEGHPKALIEAMTFGMPVIAADSPGVSQLVADGRTGILVPPTVDGIRHGLMRLRGLPADRRRDLGAAAHGFAAGQFSVQAVAARERAIFDGLLDGSRAA